VPRSIWATRENAEAMKIRDRWRRLTVFFSMMLLLEKRRGRYTRVASILALGVATIRSLMHLIQFARTTSPRPLAPYKCVQINEDGFGDPQNTYAWSMAWFKGKLYVGTNRNTQCVERAVIDAYLPELHFYTTFAEQNCDCPPCPQDMDLRAEIWAYTPETQQWARVFQSPHIPIPSYPGKYVALDIGFRGMAVFQEPDGTEALYVAGFTAGEFIPELPPPRLLRTTDGLTFEPLPQEPGTVLGDLGRNGYYGYRAMAVYTPPGAEKPRLYVTAAHGMLGLGVILESADPAKGNNHFRQVSDADINVFELAVFHGLLYAGGGDDDHGYAVWKTDAIGTPPYKLIPVVTDGAGRGTAVRCVVSMHAFKGKLYVGSNGVLPPPITCELIRINPDDSWELVVGNPRRTSQGFKTPISGLPDNFGNPLIAHFWRMQDHEGVLYLGTNDRSGWHIPHRLAARISHEFGCDLWMSEDGEKWLEVTRDGFGDKSNFGIRTLASTPFGLFVGTATEFSGTEIWLVTSA